MLDHRIGLAVDKIVYKNMRKIAAMEEMPLNAYLNDLMKKTIVEFETLNNIKL